MHISIFLVTLIMSHCYHGAPSAEHNPASSTWSLFFFFQTGLSSYPAIPIHLTYPLPSDPRKEARQDMLPPFRAHHMHVNCETRWWGTHHVGKASGAASRALLVILPQETWSGSAVTASVSSLISFDWNRWTKIYPKKTYNLLRRTVKMWNSSHSV